MSQTIEKPWTIEAFFDWQERQEERYELVGGFPLKMMTGASNRHDVIVVNILSELRSRLRGRHCRPFSADGSVETVSGQIRRPDAGVDCGPFDPHGLKAASPTAVFEVLSRSTEDFDRFRKIEEYKALASLRHIVFVEQDRPRLVAWSREAGTAWREAMLEGQDAVLALEALAIALPLSEIYDRIAFASDR